MLFYLYSLHIDISISINTKILHRNASHTSLQLMVENRRPLCLVTKGLLKEVCTHFLIKLITLFIGQGVSFSRSGEEDLIDRLDGLISIPQEWHKKKVCYSHNKDIQLNYTGGFNNIQSAVQSCSPDNTSRKFTKHPTAISSQQGNFVWVSVCTAYL